MTIGTAFPTVYLIWDYNTRVSVGTDIHNTGLTVWSASNLHTHRQLYKILHKCRVYILFPVKLCIET